MKPILFNTDMVCSLQDNRKTVTRRAVKEPYYIDDAAISHMSGLAMRRGTSITDGMPYPDRPYRPGDILYVRETWTVLKNKGTDGSPCKYGYKADNIWSVPKWSPSIHMPREAARIFLRVTDVRVERLQDITISGLQDEGILPDGYVSQFSACTTDAFKVFKSLWDSTIKEANRALYGWDANPWVWVIEFERISRVEAMAHAYNDWPIGPYMGSLRSMYYYHSPSEKPPVRHQQTCPVCGRKLVNTYRKGNVWKCRRCWEEGNQHD